MKTAIKIENNVAWGATVFVDYFLKNDSEIFQTDVGSALHSRVRCQLRPSPGSTTAAARRSMGCSVGKLDDGRKLKNSSPAILDVSDIQIQTVLQLENKKSARNGKASKNSGTTRHKRNNKSHRNKSRQHKSGDSRTYDPKITAKYDIKAVIGKGSHSRVLRVEHRISRQPYALKTVDGPEGREAFEAELSVLRRLNHPNVVKLIEVFEEADRRRRVYMVMELATGGSLLDRLEARGGGGMPEEEARAALRMLVEGVGYLHSLGITHRDLKPDSLLFYHPGKDSRLLITDFSFASGRKSSGSPFMQTVCGTPQYVAPEVVLRRPYTRAVDTWAVGVIAYVALSGHFPFDGEGDAATLRMVARGHFHMTDTVWCDVSEEGRSFVRSLLRPDPARRPSAAQSLAHPWLSGAAPSPTALSGREGGRGGSVSGGSSSSSGGGRGASLRRASGRVRAQQLDALLLKSDPEVVA